jgi:hypothetical protein
MCRKLILLTSFVLLLGFVNVTNAADIVWTGRGADKLWSNPANWEGNKVPTAADDAKIEVPGAIAPNGPLIQDGIAAECAVMWNEVAGEPTMTMTGGTLTMSGWGIWWGDGPGCKATFTMSGGTVSLTGSPGIHEFAWGGASGTWIMTGGEVFAKGVVLTADEGVSGQLLLHGGTYNIGTARGDRDDRFGGGLLMSDKGLIDITKGTLILEALAGQETRYMQYIKDLMAAGRITAYGGAGQFVMDYDGRNPGKITITAVEAGKAYKPDPADGAYHSDVWANLSWSAAASAASHNVYFGDDFDSVNNGTGDTFRGNQVDLFYIVGFAGYPYPDGLIPGTTYYWRIDEVEADGTTVHKGDIWSFTVPPKTAYDPKPTNGAQFVDLNTQLSWTAGFGAVFHAVYFGDNYDTVSAATGGTQQAATTYNPGALQAEKVYYWRVDESDALVTYKGDVWGFTTPGAAGNPQPSNGAANVQMNKTLSWTPATTASSHELYFGTDKDAVRSATAASPEYKGSKAPGSESYDPGKLSWHSTYYWRVDAVYAAPPNTVKGLVWDFTTADFVAVDDFESYNDINPGEPGSNRILEAWADGFGTTTNGALVGNDLPPYAERAIIHGGAQSMPYSYDNNLKYSEATKTLTYPVDWTQDGVTTLSLWFRGKAANAAEPMYVALNGGTPVYHDDAAVAQATDWQEWVIPLQKFADLGVNLANVNSIAIGLGTRGNTTVAGGSGDMYFDDIKLYPAPPPAVAAVINADFEDYGFIGDGVSNSGWGSFPGAAGGVVANAIPINNDEFYTNPSSFGSGWQSNGPAGLNGKYGLQHPNRTTQNDMSAPFSGSFIGFVNLDDADGFAQSIQSAVVGNLAKGTYTLTVAVGARPSGSWNDVRYEISLAANPVLGAPDNNGPAMGSRDGTVLGAPASVTLTPASAALGSNNQDLVYVLSVDAGHPNLGNPFAIRIGVFNTLMQNGVPDAGSGGTNYRFTQGNFDNVRLSVQ